MTEPNIGILDAIQNAKDIADLEKIRTEALNSKHLGLLLLWKLKYIELYKACTVS